MPLPQGACLTKELSRRECQGQVPWKSSNGNVPRLSQSSLSTSCHLSLKVRPLPLCFMAPSTVEFPTIWSPTRAGLRWFLAAYLNSTRGESVRNESGVKLKLNERRFEHDSTGSDSCWSHAIVFVAIVDRSRPKLFSSEQFLVIAFSW